MRSVLVAAFVVAFAAAAYAQGSPDAAFTDAQKLGLRLFSQSCGVCHTPVQQRARPYAPTLSRETLGGDEELIREYISSGTPRMPGFRYNFEPEQIAAIAQYLKTVPPPAAPAQAAPGRAGAPGQNDD
jgi:mono/diheme cytochrome c family protein